MVYSEQSVFIFIIYVYCLSFLDVYFFFKSLFWQYFVISSAAVQFLELEFPGGSPGKGRTVKGCISRNINYYIHLIFPRDPLAAGRQKTRLCGQPVLRDHTHTLTTSQHPPLVGDWLDYYLLWFGVVGSTICFCV